MNSYKLLLSDQLKELNDLIKKSEAVLKKYGDKNINYPKYYSSNGKSYDQFYKKENGKRIYVRVSEKETIKKAVQKEYDYKVNEKLHKLRKDLMRFLKAYDVAEINKVYEDLGRVKKKLVRPIMCSDEEFIENWKKKHVTDENYMVEGRLYKTEAGEMVRSKSEKILADLFFKNGIPYVYEMNLKLKDGSLCVPDFTLLNVRTRKTIIWEHFGMVDDVNYAVKALNKLNRYENSGITLGKELIISLESGRTALDVTRLQSKINENFFPKE